LILLGLFLTKTVFLNQFSASLSGVVVPYPVFSQAWHLWLSAEWPTTPRSASFSVRVTGDHDKRANHVKRI
jgi:hypothetical protein